MLPLSHQPLLPKVDANGRYELRVEPSVCVLIEQAGLAHAGVTEHQELEQIVVINVGGRHSANSYPSPSQKPITHHHPVDESKLEEIAVTRIVRARTRVRERREGVLIAKRKREIGERGKQWAES